MKISQEKIDKVNSVPEIIEEIQDGSKISVIVEHPTSDLNFVVCYNEDYDEYRTYKIAPNQVGQIDLDYTLGDAYTAIFRALGYESSNY